MRSSASENRTEPTTRSWVVTTRDRYRTIAIVTLNLILFSVLANLIAMPFAAAKRVDAHAHRSVWLERHGIESMRRVYPTLSDQEIEEILIQTGSFGHLYEPFIEFKSEPMVVEHTNIHRDGFRLIGREQGPWPIDRAAFNVFVFGGSTALGSGVRDDQTIPAIMQRRLREHFPGRTINVYNFATGSHYTTQERIYFELLLMKGHGPMRSYSSTG